MFKIHWKNVENQKMDNFRLRAWQIEFPEGGLGGPGGVWGGPGGALGAPRTRLGGPGTPLRMRVAAPEGPRGALGASKNRPGVFF